MHDLLRTRDVPFSKSFFRRFDSTVKLGTVVRCSGTLKFYGMSKVQFDDFSSSISVDDKLHSIEALPLSRSRRRQCDSSLKSVEKSSFMTVNSSIAWLGIAASPFCAFYASHLQQKIPCVTLVATRVQINYFHIFKQFGTNILFPLSSVLRTCKCPFWLPQMLEESVIMYSCFTLQKLLFGPLAEGSLFYTLS